MHDACSRACRRSRPGRYLILSHNRIQRSLPKSRRGFWPVMIIRTMFTRSNAMSIACLRPACTQKVGEAGLHILTIGFGTCSRCGRSWSLSAVISHVLADECLSGCPSCSDPRDLLPHLRQGDWGPRVSVGASVNYRTRSPDLGPD